VHSRGRAHLRYDIPLLTGRLMEATRWVQRHLKSDQRELVA
jgi:hypothetical protein